MSCTAAPIAGAEHGAWRQPIGRARFAAEADIPESIQIGIDTWQDGCAWCIPVERASAEAGTLRRLLYNGAAWEKVARGAWRRHGNNAGVEREILQSSSADFPPAGNVFSTTSARRWVLPPRFRARVLETAGVRGWYYCGDDALPASGLDGHMAVVQPGGMVVETYATIRLRDGTVVALSFSVTDPRGACDGYENGQTASMIPCYAGLIDRRDACLGGIGHAMAVTLPGRLLHAGAVYPALAFDRDAAAGAGRYGGAIPMGARLGIPPGIDIARLGLRSEAGARIAVAAQAFGMIVVDRGGEGMSLRAQAGSEGVQAGLFQYSPGLAADLVTIKACLRVVESA